MTVLSVVCFWHMSSWQCDDRQNCRGIDGDSLSVVSVSTSSGGLNDTWLGIYPGSGS